MNLIDAIEQSKGKAFRRASWEHKDWIVIKVIRHFPEYTQLQWAIAETVVVMSYVDDLTAIDWIIKE